MCKNDKKEKNIDQKAKQGKKLTLFLTIILFIIMIGMAIISFVYGKHKYIISKGVILIFVIVAILLVFDSIDSLNIGNLLSLKTKVKEKDKEIDKLNNENNQLRSQIITIMNTNLNSQNIYFGNPKDYVIEAADKSQTEVDEEKELMPSTTNVKDEQLVNSHKRRLLISKIEKLLLYRFQKSNSIGEINLLQDIKITNIGVASDPIIDRDIVYDAYMKRSLDEIFIEVFSGSYSSLLFDYKLYFMISRVLYYSQSNKVKAKMILIIPRYSEKFINDYYYPGRYSQHNKFSERLKEIYAPAIKNDLLEIVEINITDDDIEQLENELKE